MQTLSSTAGYAGTPPLSNRVSYVKDYDGGTHMECYVHPTIPYLAQAEMYAKQRDWVVNRIAETSASTRIYPGLPAAAFEDGNVLRHIDIPGENDTWVRYGAKGLN